MKNPKSPKSKVITFLLIAVAAFTLTMTTSCKKDVQPDQTKPISVMVKTEGLLIKEMTKSFDLSQWTYNYNPNAYELTFTGSKGKVYTFQKSISELSAGFAVTILPDNYVITYQSWHTPANGDTRLSQTLDITINENKTISTPTDLTLQALNDDFLVIMDNNCMSAELNMFNTWNSFFASPDDTFKYMYYNEERDLEIRYRDATTGENFIKTITNATKGNVYHIVAAVNGGTGINITPLSYQMIGW